MLKYKRVRLAILYTGTDAPVDILAGMAGKSRRIVSIGTTAVDGDYLRVYRDAEQIVDCDSKILTTNAPWLPMDLPLAEGQQCKVGVWPASERAAGVQIVIGYTEAD